MAPIKFFKYHGCGNDFIVIEDQDNTFLSKWRTQIPLLCQAHYGIGADGVLLIQSSTSADFRMRIFNATDGSEATMCGNGLRCLVKHWIKHHSKCTHCCTIETESGICEGKSDEHGISVTLPPFRILSPSIPLPNGLTGQLINTGTPHLVVFTKDLDSFDHLAPQFRSLINANINFAHVLDKTTIAMRTYEKGVERETFACGSGGAAVAVAYNHFPTTIVTKKNDRLIYAQTDNKLWMSGPAKHIFNGELKLPLEQFCGSSHEKSPNEWEKGSTNKADLGLPLGEKLP